MAFVLRLVLSKYRNVRLGKDGEKRPSALPADSMMLAAGMYGLMFYGERIAGAHVEVPPNGGGVTS